jgi:hypothetical protein
LLATVPVDTTLWALLQQLERPPLAAAATAAAATAAVDTTATTATVAASATHLHLTDRVGLPLPDTSSALFTVHIRILGELKPVVVAPNGRRITNEKVGAFVFFDVLSCVCLCRSFVFMHRVASLTKR